jgi:hypothetical protein
VLRNELAARFRSAPAALEWLHRCPNTAIVTAAGSVQIATSEHAFFGSDGVGLRATWRFGHVVVRPERIGKFTITAPGS